MFPHTDANLIYHLRCFVDRSYSSRVSMYSIPIKDIYHAYSIRYGGLVVDIGEYTNCSFTHSNANKNADLQLLKRNGNWKLDTGPQPFSAQVKALPSGPRALIRLSASAQLSMMTDP